MTSFFRQRPALKAGLAMTCGILLAEYLAFSLDAASVLLAASVFISVLSYLQKKRSSVAQQILSLSILCTIILLGSWKYTLDKTSVTSNILSAYADSNKTVGLLGEVQDRPQKKPRTHQLVMRVSVLGVEDRMISAEGDVLLYVARDKGLDSLVSALEVGERINVFGKIERPKGPRNPGDFDFSQYLFLHGISAVVFLKEPGGLVVSSKAPRWSPSQSIARLRARIADLIEKTVGGVEGSFLKGILIGDRSEIPTEVKTSFVNSGVMHVLAVSGLHVGMVALILLGAFSLLRLPRTWTTLLTMISLFFYMLLTGSAPSVVRATIMAFAILFAQLFQRKPDVFNSLGFAAIVVYLIDAKQLFHPGFQLSFTAVASILYFYPKLLSFSKYFPDGIKSSRAFNALWKLFAVSTAAQIGTVPFTVAYFGKVSIVSLVTNLVVIPGVGIALALGFAISFFGLFSAWLSAVYGAAEQVLLKIILNVVDFSGGLSFAYISVPRFGILDFLIFYVAALFIFNLANRDLRRAFVFPLLLLANLGILLGLFTVGPKLRVTVLDVGQGDATLVEFPSGKTLLIDGGPKSLTYDAGEKIVVPFLKRSIRKLDALVVSHPHSDHLGGVAAVMEAIPVGKVYDAGHKAESRIYREFEENVAGVKIPFIHLRAGYRVELDKDARVFVLHPTKSFVQQDSIHFLRDFNNGSVVLKLIYGSVGFLLTGDAEEPSERQMLLLYNGFLKSDLVKVGHHGSITSSREDFVDVVKPRYAAISVGANNKFGHPSSETISRYQSAGAEVMRTDLEGALMYETDGRTLRRVRWR